MTDLRCPVLLTITTVGLLLVIPAVGQSHPNVPGNTLESLRGVRDPNALNEGWQTPLMAAAFNSDEKLVKDLIERKANVNVASRFGITALMYARGLPKSNYCSAPEHPSKRRTSMGEPLCITPLSGPTRRLFGR